MKQLTEDYVSYETAVLLKEKGFDESCYQKYDDEGYLSFNHVGYINSDKPCDDFYALAPTQQMALKWLREAHKIIISFNASFVNSIEPHFSWNIRINSLKSLNDEEHFEPIYINAKSESYEESCEKALLYILKNLI